MTRSDDDLFRTWKPIPAPPALKRRVMAAALEGAMPRPTRLTDRLWQSRSLRYAWAAAATALVVVNLWLPSPGEPDPDRAAIARTSLDLDPLLVSLIADHPPTRITWSDQERLVRVLLEEARTVAPDVTADGGRS